MSLSQLPAEGEGREEHGLQLHLPLLLEGVVVFFEGVPGIPGESFAEVIIAGHTYQVKGTVLVEPEPEPEQEAPAIPARPDMHRRKDLAGQVVRQTTKIGLYDVTYNEDGYAVKASRVN